MQAGPGAGTRHLGAWNVKREAFEVDQVDSAVRRRQSAHARVGDAVQGAHILGGTEIEQPLVSKESFHGAASGMG